jgi:hypothetical protein
LIVFTLSNVYALELYENPLVVKSFLSTSKNIKDFKPLIVSKEEVNIPCLNGYSSAMAIAPESIKLLNMSAISIALIGRKDTDLLVNVGYGFLYRPESLQAAMNQLKLSNKEISIKESPKDLVQVGVQQEVVGVFQTKNDDAYILVTKSSEGMPQDLFIVSIYTKDHTWLSTKHFGSNCNPDSKK